MLVTQWPIDAATTENGALVIVRDGFRVLAVDRCGTAERQARRDKLATLVAEVAARAPEVKVTDDAAGRITDVTWDIGENERVAPDTCGLRAVDHRRARRAKLVLQRSSSRDVRR